MAQASASSGALAAEVASYVGWPCDTSSLEHIGMSPAEATDFLKAAYAQQVGTFKEAVGAFFLRELTMPRKLQAALVPSRQALVIIDPGSRACDDNLRGAIFRQLVRHAQRQRFPQFFADLDKQLAAVYVLRKPLSETDRALCARTLDRLLWADGHVEYVAAQAREYLFPRESEVQPGGLWDWIVALVESILNAGKPPADDLERAVRCHARLARDGQSAVVEKGFQDPLIAEMLVHGRWPYTVTLPFGQADAYVDEFFKIGQYRFYDREMPQRHGPSPEALLDARAEPLEAGKQLIRIGEVDSGVQVLWDAGVAHRNVACLEELLRTISHTKDEVRWMNRTYEAILEIDAEHPDAVAYFK